MSGSVYFWGRKRYNTDIYLLERNNTLERKQLAPGVFITTLDASKFNRCRITIHLRFPARRESATDAAVLALVLERGYAACPDMTALSRRLAELYGADLGVDLSNAGGSIEPEDGVTVCSKGEMFSEVIPMEDMASISVGGVVFPITAE